MPLFKWVDNLPNWLRCILVLPMVCIAYIVSGRLVHLCLSLCMPYDTLIYDIARVIGFNTLPLFCIMYVAFSVTPRKASIWLVLVLLILFILILGAITFFYIVSNQYSWQFFCSTILSLFTLVITFMYFFKTYSEGQEL